jgi:hypothetical protein
VEIIWLRRQIAECDLGVHRDLQRIGGDVHARGIDAVGQHALDRGFHHDRIQRREFFLGDFHGLGLVLGHEPHRHLHAVDHPLRGVGINIVARGHHREGVGAV